MEVKIQLYFRHRKWTYRHQCLTAQDHFSTMEDLMWTNAFFRYLEWIASSTFWIIKYFFFTWFRMNLTGKYRKMCIVCVHWMRLKVNSNGFKCEIFLQLNENLTIFIGGNFNMKSVVTYDWNTLNYTIYPNVFLVMNFI